MSSGSEGEHHSIHYVPLLICMLVGLLGWFCPAPTGMTADGWHILVIFVVTILGLIIKPLPMGAVAMVALLMAILTKVVTMKQAFSAFSSDVVWLVVFALFIAKGFNVTGLGKRIGYFFTALLGKKTLGLSYGLMVTDLVLAPGIPSVTSRSAGIVYPILQAIANSYKSFPTMAATTASIPIVRPKIHNPSKIMAVKLMIHSLLRIFPMALSSDKACS